MTLDTAASGYTIQATSTGLSNATTGDFDVAPAATTKLVVTADPLTSVVAGSTFDVEVVAEDAFGNTATGFTGPVSLALKTNTGNNLEGSASVNAAAGVADFPSLVLKTAAKSYTIAANSAGLTSATTASFDVVPAAASKLVINQGPTTPIIAGDPFSVGFIAEDQYGNLATQFTGQVGISLKTNSSINLTGSVLKNAAAGVSEFSGLVLPAALQGYIIQASSSGLAGAMTNPFDVVPAAAAVLVVTNQPPVAVTAGKPFDVTVTAKDLFGNVASGFTGVVTVALKLDPNGSMIVRLNANAASGVANFPDLTLKTAAKSNTILATSTGLERATTNTFEVVAAAASTLVVTDQPARDVTADQFLTSGSRRWIPMETWPPASLEACGSRCKATPAAATWAAMRRPTPSAVLPTSLVYISTRRPAVTRSSAASAGLTATLTSAFNVIAAAPSQLLITTFPTTIAVGRPFGLTVSAEDRFGNLATSTSGAVTLSLNKKKGVKLIGKNTTTLSGGMATFSSLKFKKCASGLILKVSAPGLSPAVTKGFNVKNAKHKLK